MKRAGFGGPDLRSKRAGLDEKFPARVRDPDDFCAWKSLAKSGDRGKRVHDVAESAEAHDQKARLRHAAPCERTLRDHAWNDLWDRRRWRLGCRDAERSLVRELFPRCSRFLWRERRGGDLRGATRRSVR